ncbi:MAG: outer membrane protein assembly factor BamC [Gammaproteobacteria bacterium]|nr:outer membrane protein assembly factor BamC [Gammaproteobacteria bacterium]
MLKHFIAAIRPLAFSIVALGILTGCGGTKKSDEDAIYKNASIGNSLEIPPGLSSVPPNEANRIPSASGVEASASGQQNADTFDKFRQWEEFERYMEWRKQQGPEQADFKAFQATKKSAQGYDTGDGGASPQPSVAVARDVDGRLTLILKDDYSQAWRRVGQTLDKMYFAVEDKDRNGGTYTIRYIDEDNAPKKKSWFSKLWNKSDTDESLATQYDLTLARDPLGTRVTAVDAAGEHTETGDQIITLLYEQMNSDN